jgi:hypothetical protein
MSNATGLTPELEVMARKLADDIKARRTGLDNEDRLANGIELSHYARAKKYREQDRARVNGMVIALTYMLGSPLDMRLAEQFIEDTPDLAGPARRPS